MGLDVCRLDGRGRVVQRVTDAGDHLAGLAEGWLAAGNTRCLKLLDPYSDVTFQGPLLARLRDELEGVPMEPLSDRSRACLGAVLALVVAACGEPDARVLFQGD